MSNNRYILQFRRNNGYAESRDKAVELIKSELPKCKEGEAVLCKWKDSEKDGVLMGVSNGDGSYKYMDVDETTSTAIPLKMAEEFSSKSVGKTDIQSYVLQIHGICWPLSQCPIQ